MQYREGDEAVSIDEAIAALEAAGANIRFRQLLRLCAQFFGEPRIRGSHHIFTHPDISELLNLQEVRGEAKPYQIRQFLRLVERYNLKLREE